MSNDLLAIGVLGTMSWTQYEIEWALPLGMKKAFCWLRHFPMENNPVKDERDRVAMYESLVDSFHVAGLTASLGQELKECSELEKKKAVASRKSRDGAATEQLWEEWMGRSHSLTNDIYQKVRENHGSSVCALVILGHLWAMLAKPPGGSTDKEANQQAFLESHWKDMSHFCPDLNLDTGRLSKILIQHSPDVLLQDERYSQQVLNRLKQPASILILSADARDEQRLRLGEECREMDREVQTGRLKDALKIHQANSCRVRDITEALDRYKPAILHFSGHGNASAIVFEDDRGCAVEVDKTALAGLLETQEGLGLVVLNACFSQDNAQAIANAVGYVIGMEGSLGDSAAISFSREFYRALSYGRTIDDAFIRAKSAVALTSSMRCHLVKRQ